jgi:type I restriction enzyme M protein
MTPNEIAAFFWSVADLIRDHFKRGKYQDVILPFTVLRRLDCVLAPSKQKVLVTAKDLKAKGLKNPEAQLRRASGYAFYNISQYDFQKLLDDPKRLHGNLGNYIAGFSTNMAEVLEKFDFPNTLKKLSEADLLFKVVERFAGADLSLQAVDNHQMGTVFEELIRRFNEATDENPGEHFTPREIVRLMVDLLVEGDPDRARPEIIRTVFDPCCGTGGMLSIAQERLRGINARAKAILFGQEVNPETFAICKSDMFMKSEKGAEAENIVFGSSLRSDAFPGKSFDYLIANPPYGKEWKQDEEWVQAEHEKGSAGRFNAGLPPRSDGQMLFLELMLSKMKAAKDGLSRVAIVMNGSPLFTGDAGSGSSEIRRWIFENDWLEAIIALPEQMFYNTGISTYVWVLANKKESRRKGKVQLIDASEMYQKMRKSLGDKRREMSEAHIGEVLKLYRGMKESETCKIFKNEDFGYRRITVERPLRLNFQASPERIERLKGEKAFLVLAENANGKNLQKGILELLAGLGNKVFKNRASFETALSIDKSNIMIKTPVVRAIFKSLAERDESADLCKGADSQLESDSELRDYENVPLAEGIQAYFDREVKPHVPEAWINAGVTDDKDHQVGIVGYEIPFTRHFYKYVPPRPLEEIEAEIKKLEAEIAAGLKEL